MSRDGSSKILAGSIDGEPISKFKIVFRDSQDRIWITVSTRIRNWMHALRTDLADGQIRATRAAFSPEAVAKPKGRHGRNGCPETSREPASPRAASYR